MPSTLFELLRLGGPIMWVILGASIVAVAVFLERVYEYRRMGVPLDPFLDGINALVREKRFTEALERCDEAHGPAVRVVQAALLKRDLPLADLREALQEVAQLQVPRLEKNLSILATVGYIAPLLGLLGTVTGMINVFQTVNRARGTVPVGELAGGNLGGAFDDGGRAGGGDPCLRRLQLSRLQNERRGAGHGTGGH